MKGWIIGWSVFCVLLVGMILTPLFMGIYPANAGLWEKLSSMSNQTVKSSVFNIEAKGWDLRGYLFQPPETNKTCLFVAGKRKGGLTCW